MGIVAMLDCKEKFTLALALFLLFSAYMFSIVRRTYLVMKARAYGPSFSRNFGGWIRSYSYSEDEFFVADGAKGSVVEKRQKALADLEARFAEKFGVEVVGTCEMAVPFPFQAVANSRLPVSKVAVHTSGPYIEDSKGNRTIDLTASYGVNVAGIEQSKTMIAKGFASVSKLGPVQGVQHAVAKENVAILQKVSRCDEVSFHMSGEEALNCAVRLAKFNTGRTRTVQFCGDSVSILEGAHGQPNLIDDALKLKELDHKSIRAIRAYSSNIASVVVTPIQGFNVSKAEYTQWLNDVKNVCHECDVPFIFDENDSGFRLAPGGAQEYYNVKADVVVYGKTVAAGMPAGVVCGSKKLMRRTDPQRPFRAAYVVSTSSASPLVMGPMNEFLKWITQPSTASLFDKSEAKFDQFINATNAALKAENLPVTLSNVNSVFTISYDIPSRYHWMLQYYLRAEGLNLSSVGTGYCVLSLDFTSSQLVTLQSKIISAAKAMRDGAWWSANASLSHKSIARSVRREVVNQAVTAPTKTFVANVMKQKEIDHVASHSNLINQFLHFISSCMFIWCYAVVLSTGKYEEPVKYGLLSLLIRQSGHYIFEPPCHDAEQAQLGFDTEQKVKIVCLYLSIPFALYAKVWAAENGYISGYLVDLSIADFWWVATLCVVWGRVSYLFNTLGFTISMHWWIKFITDPFTDLPAYYEALYQIWMPKYFMHALSKSFPATFGAYSNPKYDVGGHNKHLVGGGKKATDHIIE
jgi:glutamate-1-semialdehyde 2,1-aminomutase